MTTATSGVTPAPPTITPTFQKFIISDSAGRQTMRIITSQNVVLSHDPDVAFDDAVTIPVDPDADLNLVVYADQVTICGDLVMPGCSLTVVAGRLTTAANPKAPPSPMPTVPRLSRAQHVLIDTSGASGKPPGDKMPAGTAESQKSGGVPLGQQAKAGSSGTGILLEVDFKNSSQFSNVTRWKLTPSATSHGGPGWSAKDHTEMVGLQGAMGAAGQPGGAITLLVRAIDGEPLVLCSNGGNGGDGQDGQDGVKGGDGGPGKNAVWPNFGQMYAASNGGPAGSGGAAGRGGPGGAGGKPGPITVCSVSSELTVRIMTSQLAGMPGQDGLRGNPGDPGNPGSGGLGYQGKYTAANWDPDVVTLLTADGNQGAPGSQGAPAAKRTLYRVDRANYYGPGSPTFAPDGRLSNQRDTWLGYSGPRLLPDGTPVLRPSGDIAADLAALDTPSTVAWLQLIVDKLRIATLTTEPTDHAAYEDLGQRIDWLTSTLTTLDQTMSPTTSGKVAVTSARSKAWALSLAHVSGLDAFGMAPGWVPAMSASTYLDRAAEATTALGHLEAATHAFWLQAATAQQAQASSGLDSVEVTAGRKQVDDLVTQVRSDVKQAREDLAAAEKSRAAAKTQLQEKLNGLETAVSEVFDLDPTTLLNCISQMSFAGGSFGGSAALIGSQMGLLLKNADDNMNDDLGKPVSKSALVAQLDSFIGEEWKSAVTKNKDGFLEDSGSYAYLDELSRVRQLIDTFAQRLDLATGVHDADAALDDYVDTVDKRNRLVDRFNDGVRKLNVLTAETDRLAGRATEIGNALSTKSDPGAAAWADYYRGLTDQVRLICLDNLARAYRAAAFWCLHDIATFRDWLLHNPGEVTAASLQGAITMATNALDKSVDTFHALPNVFPTAAPPGAEWTPGGVLVVLTPEAHGWVFRSLRRCGFADFELLPPDAASALPASHSDPTDAAQQPPITQTGSPNDYHCAVHPFADRANVRLTTVRPWIEGMVTTNDTHYAVLEHRGRERFRTVDDKPFPPAEAGGYLCHDPAVITFRYNASAYDFDVKKGFAAAALDTGVDLGDGSLIFNSQAAEAGAVLPVPASYAPIGPFGTWRLRINSKENPGADLSTITRIIIDFHGYCDGPFT